MQVIEVYKHILTDTANLEILDQDNSVVVNIADDGEEGIKQPVTIGGKILRLPTPEFLAVPDWQTYVPFHPLSELPQRGESEVLRVLRAFIVANMNQVLSVLMEELVRIGANTESHKHLTVAASECLDAIPKADAKSVKDIIRVLKEMDDDSVRDIGEILNRLDTSNRRKLVNFYLKRNGKYKNKEYSRVCVVDFPFMVVDDETSSEREIFGVKLRAKDYVGFRKLLAFIVDTDEPNGEKYNAATATMTAPYLTVLLESWFKLANRLNKVIKVYQKYIPQLADLKFDTSWHSAIEDFQKLILEIPPLDGNRGVAVDAEETPANKPKVRANRNLIPADRGSVKEEAPAQAAVSTPAPQPTAPVQSAPAPAAPATGLTWAQLQAQQRQQTQQLAPPPQPVYQQPVYNQPQYQQPVYNQPQNWASAALSEQNHAQPVYQQPASTNPLRDSRPAYGQYGSPQYSIPGYRGI